MRSEYELNELLLGITTCQGILDEWLHSSYDLGIEYYVHLHDTEWDPHNPLL